MPVIYMRHDVHGAKVATLEAEAVADEGNGWVRYTLNAVLPKEAPPKRGVTARAHKVGEPDQSVNSAVPSFLSP